MASSYDFLLQDFANWQPNIPQARTANPYAPQDFQLPSTVPPIDAAQPDQSLLEYWGGDGGTAAQGWGAVMIPLMQLLSNNNQFQTEFGEAQNRFWDQNTWNQGRDQFNMDLAGRQQSSQEQQALWTQGNFQDQLAAQAQNDEVARTVALGELGLSQEAQAAQVNQWAQSFAAQQQNDEHARRIADQRLALEEQTQGRQLDQAERNQLWQEEYGRARIEADREAARYQTFGRSQGPAKWSASWG